MSFTRSRSRCAFETGPSYAKVPLDSVHTPPRVFGITGYEKYRDCLRFEFEFRCAYCLSHESEVAPGEKWGCFEIEHFKPKGIREFRRLRNAHSNLLWVCHACNRAKGNRWPSDDELPRGFRFVNPREEGLANHLEFRGTSVVALQPPGEYMIDEINLNSKTHLHRRTERAELAKRLAMLAAMIEIKRPIGNPEVLNQLDQHVSDLWRKIAIGPPWDPPRDCLCKMPQVPRTRKTSRKKRKRLRATLK